MAPHTLPLGPELGGHQDPALPTLMQGLPKSYLDLRAAPGMQQSFELRAGLATTRAQVRAHVVSAMNSKGPENLKFSPRLSDNREGVFFNWICNS